VGRAPDIRYTKSGELNIAYSVTGEGPDLVVAPGFISHLEVGWEEPSIVHFYSRLASFRRLIAFDKRGTGLSDPATHAPTLEESVDDLRAVMDAAGVERADVLGVSEGGTMAMLLRHVRAPPGGARLPVGGHEPGARDARRGHRQELG
jgi:pimeloyl-ACP methyl ester carboxylesterase